MITAGVDVGAKAVKVAILDENHILGSSVLMADVDLTRSIEEAYTQALEKAKIPAQAVDKVIATGVGRSEVPFAHDTITDIVADARGAALLLPQARTIIDVGAEEGRAVKSDGSGRVMAFAKNDKCAAGVGSFIESMARALELTLEEMGPLSLQSNKNISMNATCVVFAESEVISLIHTQTPKQDIARAIYNAIATRTASLVRRIDPEPEMAFIGGLARNEGMVALLEEHLGQKVLIPEEPLLVGAIGAALVGQKHKESEGFNGSS